MDIEKDVLKELPTKEIYTDLLKPSACRIGKTAEDILKFVSLPFSFLGMTAEELEKKYREFITSALNKVPEDRREKPSPLIAGPLFEHIKYLFEDNNEKILENMFSELLKNACNKDIKKYVQPSYVYSLQQITGIEARLLNLIYENDIDGENLGVVFRKIDKITDKVIKVFSKEAEPLEEFLGEDYSNVFFTYYIAIIDDDMEISQEKLRMSLNILEQLNLVKQFTINKYRDKNEYSLEEHNKEHVEEFDPYKRLSGYTLTGYARDMMKLCVSDKEDNSISVFVCSNCGALFAYDENYKFCPFCGNKDVVKKSCE